jgi:hypothetical protein
MNMDRIPLDDIKVHVKLKLSALWAAIMFCYVYGDYFGLYVPGQLQGMLAGGGPIGPTSQPTLAAVSLLMAVPGTMVFLSVVLPPVFSRWLNISLGLFYTAIVLATMPGAWAFYIFMSAIEIVLQLLIVWYAWKWPRMIQA